jgi:NAD(P)-dependent dehydrogenase (short-subunit alcohol dehydrogenase family)
MKNSGTLGARTFRIARGAGQDSDHRRRADDELPCARPGFARQASAVAWLPYPTAAGAERRIRFNAVTPGPVETPLLPGFRESTGLMANAPVRLAAISGPSLERLSDEITCRKSEREAMSRLRRHGRPSDHSTRAARSQNLSSTVRGMRWQRDGY